LVGDSAQRFIRSRQPPSPPFLISTRSRWAFERLARRCHPADRSCRAALRVKSPNIRPRPQRYRQSGTTATVPDYADVRCTQPSDHVPNRFAARISLARDAEIRRSATRSLFYCARSNGHDSPNRPSYRNRVSSGFTMGLFRKNRSAGERSQESPEDEIGFRYRSALSADESIALWRLAVSNTYQITGDPVEYSWSLPVVPSTYVPFSGGGIGRPPTIVPNTVLVMTRTDSQDQLLLAVWDEIVSMGISGAFVELWSVTSEHPLGLQRQRIELSWYDQTLSRMGYVERGLWGARPPADRPRM